VDKNIVECSCNLQFVLVYTTFMWKSVGTIFLTMKTAALLPVHGKKTCQIFDAIM
jgi:hypothetical protein